MKEDRVFNEVEITKRRRQRKLERDKRRKKSQFDRGFGKQGGKGAFRRNHR